MVVRALSLSGGAARGSFQLGALVALYEVYGFRPDLITGTSVDSVNGIMLAVAPPPAVNEPEAILASVAAGKPEPGLTALRALEAEWATFTTIHHLLTIQPPFAGSLIEDVLNSMNAPPSGEPPVPANVSTGSSIKVPHEAGVFEKL